MYVQSMRPGRHRVKWHGSLSCHFSNTSLLHPRSAAPVKEWNLCAEFAGAPSFAPREGWGF